MIVYYLLIIVDTANNLCGESLLHSGNRPVECRGPFVMEKIPGSILFSPFPPSGLLCLIMVLRSSRGNLEAVLSSGKGGLHISISMV